MVERTNGRVDPGSPLRLLCVDDRAEDAELERLVLRRAGYDVAMDRVANDEQLRAALRVTEYDVVFLDYTLPGWDADAALRAVLGERPELPVICVAGTIGEDTAVEMLKLGASDYVLKERMTRLPMAVLRALEGVAERRAREVAEEKLKAALVGMVQAMGALVEIRDPYTAGHERRSAELVVAIARELGLDDEAVAALDLTARMHDIGQIAVPAEILTRPARLSPMEFSLVKMHPQVAFDILSPIDFGHPVAEIILQHHERLDGSGYPSGLMGEEIMLEARILAVADVVEAMSSHRPYRPSLGIDAALQEIASGAGRLYDAGVCAACVCVFAAGFAFTL